MRRVSKGIRLTASKMNQLVKYFHATNFGLRVSVPVFASLCSVMKLSRMSITKKTSRKWKGEWCWCLMFWCVCNRLNKDIRNNATSQSTLIGLSAPIIYGELGAWSRKFR